MKTQRTRAHNTAPGAEAFTARASITPEGGTDPTPAARRERRRRRRAACVPKAHCKQHAAGAEVERRHAGACEGAKRRAQERPPVPERNAARRDQELTRRADFRSRARRSEGGRTRG